MRIPATLHRHEFLGYKLGHAWFLHYALCLSDRHQSVGRLLDRTARRNVSESRPARPWLRPVRCVAAGASRSRACLPQLGHHLTREQLHRPHHVRMRHLPEGHIGPKILDVVLLLEPAKALHQLFRSTEVGRVVILSRRRALALSGCAASAPYPCRFRCPRSACDAGYSDPHPGQAGSRNFSSLLFIFGHVCQPEEGHVLHCRPLPNRGTPFKVEGADAQHVFVGGVGAGQDRQVA